MDLSKYDCDRSYLLSAIENKRRVIALEDQCVREVDSIIDGYETELVQLINSFVQSRGKNEFNINNRADRAEFVKRMKVITANLTDALLEKELEATVQTFELVVNDQVDLLSDYLDLVAEQGCDIVNAGEQAESGDKRLTKPGLTATKAEFLMRKPRVKKTPDERVRGAVETFEQEFLKIFDESTGTKKPTSSVEVINKMRRSLESSVRRQSEFSMRSGVQAVEEMAYMEVWKENELHKPTEWQRVEVMDGHVCLECMFVDSTYNDKPLGLLHYNCRGMDIPVYYDKSGRRIYVDGVKYSKRRLTFNERFDRLSKKQQMRLLGKGNYALYLSGKLRPDEFISYGSQITLGEAERHVALKSIRKYVKTPETAMQINAMLEEGFPKITRMNVEQLRAYEKVLGEQRKIISFVPKKNFTPEHTYADVVSELDQKYELVQLRYKQLERR